MKREPPLSFNSNSNRRLLSDLRKNDQISFGLALLVEMKEGYVFCALQQGQNFSLFFSISILKLSHQCESQWTS